ncbi:hypothetical protein EYD10_15207 [Varanus komodoensis]|uniref:CDKN2A interacting protein n=1 Tax=Varanus komodoensis TaxID=61221 RepID=A0A8D2KT50_VARKO|nr:CDKN2A-interacting protein [Varanus komodoensis]KAF7238033.1 hypothetical protein EYD10_15207 [Varanus komodoensis]
MADGEAATAGPGSVSSPGNEKMGEAGDAGFDWVEKLRGKCEPEQHWHYRREFLIRNGEALSLSLGGKDDDDSAELRRLVSFSMVWANHVFLGCRYSPQVMEKVKDMAAGITVTNAPTHTLRDELVAKVKRGISSSNEGPGEPCKKRAVSTDKAPKVSGSDAKSTKADVLMETHTESVKNPGKEASKNPVKAASSAGAQKAASSAGAQKAASSAGAQKAASAASSIGLRIEPRVANYDSTTSRHKSALTSLPGPESKMNYCLTKSSESEKVLPSEKKVSLEGSAMLASKSSSHTSVVPVKVPCKLLTSEDAKERQPFFNRLYKAVAWKLVAVGGFSPNVNHVELLNSSVQSVKATLDVEFVPLKELADLPQNKSSQESVVCELRCRSVYLGTGCGKSKENAKAVASREALKLFLKKKVIVKLCKRKYKGREIEDLVLLDEESKPLNLPPALRNPQEILQINEAVTAFTSK